VTARKPDGYRPHSAPVAPGGPPPNRGTSAFTSKPVKAPPARPPYGSPASETPILDASDRDRNTTNSDPIAADHQPDWIGPMHVDMSNRSTHYQVTGPSWPRTYTGGGAVAPRQCEVYFLYLTLYG